MAKYLDTSQISSELMQLLKEAKERIILVTYSLQVNTQIQERLRTKSKLGTLGEITLIYGKTELKRKELKWMEDIEDLKIFQKKNLHAKCFVNEKKAIISSMNLSDYSQTKNVEMGFLITKDEDPEAFRNMMDDIDDLRINGIRKKPFQLEEVNIEVTRKNEEKNEEGIQKKQNLSYSQQIKKQLLEKYRNEQSSILKQNSEIILSDKTILDIVTKNNINYSHLKQILKSDKKVKQLGNEILKQLDENSEFTVGEIIDTRYQDDEFSYDQIRMKILANGDVRWYDTTEEVPKKNKIVAVKLNKSWFNSYLVLEETDIKDHVDKPSYVNFSNSKYKTTKELSEITGIISREINSILVSNNLMYKKVNDWYVTSKGKKYGGIQKDGQYGKFIIWPEEIINELQLVDGIPF